MKFNLRQASVALSLAASGLAQAATIGYGPVTIGSAQTDWDSFINLTQFDHSLGTLQAVDIALTGILNGSAGVENLSSRTATVTLALQGNLELQRPDNSSLISMPDNLLISMTGSLPKYDGTTDFGGTSGTLLSPGALTISGNATLNNPGDLALFTGNGSVALPILAFADSSFMGPGNATTFFTMMAGVSASVSYTYAAAPLRTQPPITTAVPEPGTYALMALGLLGIGLRARRRGAKVGGAADR